MFSRNTHHDLCNPWGKARSAVWLGRIYSNTCEGFAQLHYTKTSGNSWYKHLGLIGQWMAIAKRRRFPSEPEISTIPHSYHRSSEVQYCKWRAMSDCAVQGSSRAPNLCRHTTATPGSFQGTHLSSEQNRSRMINPWTMCMQGGVIGKEHLRHWLVRKKKTSKLMQLSCRSSEALKLPPVIVALECVHELGQNSWVPPGITKGKGSPTSYQKHTEVWHISSSTVPAISSSAPFAFPNRSTHSLSNSVTHYLTVAQATFPAASKIEFGVHIHNIICKFKSDWVNLVGYGLQNFNDY